MTWFRDPKPEPQADGDDGSLEHLPDDMIVSEGDEDLYRTQASPPGDPDESKTTREPYPRLLSIEQDESIWFLRGRLKQVEGSYLALAKRVEALEK